MNRKPAVILPLLAGAALGACAKADPPTGATFEVKVAPVSLAGITNACYRVTVTNQPDRAGEIVWQQPSICADDFGDGAGAISYVGSCDANATVQNSVTIELLDLYSGSTPVAIDDDEYVNPCGMIADWSNPADRGLSALEDAEDQNGPCTINRTCQENADVLVEFDLTIMRDADQGFFDVAVEFEDIFCSAKLDCDPALLHDGDGERNATAIVAFACTAGENEETWLRVSDLHLSCNGGNQIIDIDATPVAGQHGSPAAGVFESAVYIGDEQLTSNGQPIEKCYWNRAIGLDLDTLVQPCTLSGVAIVSAAPFTTSLYTAEGASYPAITWNVPVLTANGLCAEHRLDADGSGVRSTYLSDDLDAATLSAFTAAFAGGASFTCGGDSPPGGPIAGLTVLQQTSAIMLADPDNPIIATVTTIGDPASPGQNYVEITLNDQSVWVEIPAGTTPGDTIVPGQCCND